MPSIYVKDELRAAVEAASGGKQTVLYTASGQPSIMNIIPKFNLEDIDPSLGSGVHPAFIVGGVEKRELFIGSYQGIIKNGEFISLPGVDPSVSAPYDSFINAARAAGPGFHVMTNAEYAALALWCWKNGFQPRGNTNYGRSHEATYETARRQDAGAPGDTNNNGRSLTGSGPVSWRHDNSPNGISDLCGNILEWAAGMRLVDGEIQVIANNDAALHTTDMGRSSKAWRAISSSDGALVAPGTAGTLKYDAGTPTGGDVILSNSIVNQLGDSNDDSNSAGSASMSVKNLTAKPGLKVPELVKALGLFPVSAEGMKEDTIYMRNFGERVPFRGGNWNNGSRAGIFTLNLSYPRTSNLTNLGARPAFVE
ncbi:hypothetical protein KOE80_10865 [Alcaligenes sp. 13f]|uniref:hypothetical protein n=1 Tax=Alcaligenes sp. 13f TaxID=2841924 RepID=UPI001CF6F426|nr:hypothetical protein [Alcaligenes sp. 13f]MCB4322700.1 hypothetical protein [Alcaligenes sp. 13f]